MTRTRTLLSGLVALSLLFAACGGDDSSDASDEADETTTTADAASTDDTAVDEADGETIDVCAFIDLDTVSSLTGETFTTTEQTEDDTCQVTNDEQTALLQLSVKLLEADETEEGFISDATEACDPGTEITGLDFSYATAGFACEISDETALAAAHEGGAALLIGHPSDASVTSEQIATALNQILQSIVSA